MSAARDTGRFAYLATSIFGIHWLMRVPIALYRARLGFLLGHRFLLLEHHGRVSGRRRLVLLEVIGRPATGSYLVASGFGTRAQWYRNVRTAPHVRIASGSGGLRAAEAQFLPADQAALALDCYAKAHPKAWASFRPILDVTLGAAAQTVPVVRFDVLSGSGLRHG